MAETRLTNVIVPEVFTDYTLEPWYERSRFFQSNIIDVDSMMVEVLNGGGTTFNVPFWKPITGDTDIPVEGTDQTVNAITSGKEIARRQFRTKAYGQNALSSVSAGDEPLNRFANDVRSFWTKAYDKNLIASLKGVYLDNVANDSSDLVNDGSGSSFSDDGVIDAQAKLGENGTVGRSDSEDYVGICVHSAIYTTMRKNDLIDFVPISGQPRPIPFYMGMMVIVDDNATIVSTSPNVYLNIIFKSAAVKFGIGTQRYEATSFDRNELDGFGVDQVITRRVFGIHPTGFAWSDSSVAGTSPTDLELALAVNWDRVYNKQNIGFVYYTSLV